MPITPLPTPVPSRADPANFAARGDAFLSALPAFATETEAARVEINGFAATCESAAQTVNVSAWISGAAYAVGNNAFDPVTFLTYRRKTAGAGTTRPGLDGTNWQLLTGFGDVDLASAQTLTNKTHGAGSVWSGDAIPVANGGTGSTTAAAAFNAIKQAASTTATGVVELATDAEAQAGTDAARAVTPDNLGATVLGMGQTWQDLTASRSISTTYTNSTGRTIAFAVRFTVTLGTLAGLRVAGLDILSTQGGNASATADSLFAVIPPGATYSAQALAGSPNVSNWFELR